MAEKDSPRAILLTLLAPMLAAAIGCRAYLHLIDPDSDLNIAGYNVHHLYSGVLLLIPAALALACGIKSWRGRQLARVVLGAGSGLVLDEVVYLIATDGSNAAYLTPISVWGAVVLVGLATVLILWLAIRS